MPRAPQPCPHGTNCFWLKNGTCKKGHGTYDSVVANIPDAQCCLFSEETCPYLASGCTKKHISPESMAPRECKYAADLQAGNRLCRKGNECPHYDPTMEGVWPRPNHVCRFAHRESTLNATAVEFFPTPAAVSEPAPAFIPAVPVPAYPMVVYPPAFVYGYCGGYGCGACYPQ